MTTNATNPAPAAPAAPGGGPGPGFASQYVVNADTALAQPFKGVTTDGAVIPGLYGLQQTGVSTAPIREAAEAYLESLTPYQRRKTLFGLDAPERRIWSNIHPPLMRHGLAIFEMLPTQREKALALLQASMSVQGLETARDVMRLNWTVAEMTGKFDEYGEGQYWLTVMGTPSGTEPWGWQVDGHHCIINYFVLGDQVVMTPTFLGSEPVFAAEGKYAGTRVFHAEEQRGTELLRSLSAEQQAQAIIGTELPPDVFTTAFRDNFELRYEGIRYADLAQPQQRLLWQIVETYVGRIRPGHADVKLEEVSQHLGSTHFAWIGSTDDDGVFYYRVHSPVILIEFDHQRGVAFRGVPHSRNHIHTVVRTPNGNDYGLDLLRQHHERHKH